MSSTLPQLPYVTGDAFDAEVLEADAPVLVEFTAAWCPPCRMMEPVLAGLQADREDLKVVKLDVDAELATAARFEVLSMPTFLLFRHGRGVLRMVGARPRARLERELDAALAA